MVVLGIGFVVVMIGIFVIGGFMFVDVVKVKEIEDYMYE